MKHWFFWFFNRRKLISCNDYKKYEEEEKKLIFDCVCLHIHEQKGTYKGCINLEI